MGLNEILDIQETQVPGPQGNLETTFRVVFTTEQASGSFTVDIPAEDFTPEVARQQASERADEIDAAFTTPDEE
jgi:hypothetical protein